MARDMPGPPVSSSPDGRPDVEGQGADLPGAGQTPGAVEAPPSVAAAAGAQPAPKPSKPRKLLYVTLPGCWGALIAGCLSFTPSLLPRGGIVQGLIWGITAAIGYGLGVLAAWIWRASLTGTPGGRGAGPGSLLLIGRGLRGLYCWARSMVTSRLLLPAEPVPTS
jgi:Alpha/beta-hydrolase family N-terminus